MLGLLTPPDTSPKDQDAAAAAAAAGDNAGSGGVRHCLVLCQELVKELKQFGQDLFEEWQVSWHPLPQHELTGWLTPVLDRSSSAH